MYWIRKIYIAKQFREIIYTKFREMYWYLKNLHNETISRNNVYEISQNFAKFRERKYNEISRNFAKLKSLSSLFRISRNKKILFRDHPTVNQRNTRTKAFWLHYIHINVKKINANLFLSLELPKSWALTNWTKKTH
jgi:hydroxymethylpyrimidine pyrophosphatase-like HAD family hydrolase